MRIRVRIRICVEVTSRIRIRIKVVRIRNTDAWGRTLYLGKNSTPGNHRVGRVLSFFSSRRNWDSPNPSPADNCAPPFGSGGRGPLAGETGGGRVPIPTRGHTLWYSLYVCTSCWGQNTIPGEEWRHSPDRWRRSRGSPWWRTRGWAPGRAARTDPAGIRSWMHKFFFTFFAW